MVVNSLPLIEEINFATTAEFLAYLSPNQSHWKLQRDVVWIYRGQGNAKWELQPSAWRPEGGLKLAPFIEKFEDFRPDLFDLFTSCSQNPERATEYTLRIAAEYEAAHQFLELVDELGYAIPRNGGDTMFSGRGYLEYVLEHHHVVQFILSVAWALVQHHGIPTRLLDWSRDSLKAAFFASSDNESDSSVDQSEAIAVWAIDIGPKKGSNFPFPYEKLVCPRSNHSFLHSQDGLLLAPVYGRADSYYLNNGEWPNVLDELRANFPVGCSPIRKITLPKSQVPDLRECLWGHRISKAHLMPALNNVAETVLWRSRIKY